MLRLNPIQAGIIVISSVTLTNSPLAAQTTNSGTEPIFWCDMSRSQVSHERDAGLAQIEILKIRNAQLEAKIKDMEAKAKQPAAEKGASPNE